MEKKKELQERKDELMQQMTVALETGNRRVYNKCASELSSISKELLDDEYSNYRTNRTRGSRRKVIGISMSEALHDRVRKECELSGFNASQLVTELLISYFKKKDGGKE